METQKFSYDNTVVRNFIIASIVYGIIGMFVGIWAASELFAPALNFNIQYITFGRIRPLHTDTMLFAFVGNAIFAGVYYSVQRVLKARMFSDTLSKIHFWGWQLTILLGAITLAFGFTSTKEYAEYEWPIDICIAILWTLFGVNMIGTIVKRRERHIYVGLWFYISTWVTIVMLYLINNFELPVTMFKSYSWYAGVQDALVQWWYGHNAVAFYLTTPYLGLMYYYLPKLAERPVYSYKLSILHFWTLIFIYIWAGPHHLLYTSLPDWAQSLGTTFSIMLLAPSWGGMINGLLTLRGAWDKVRNDDRLKFMVVAVTAYGMVTFEGPMLALKNVNALAHYTDWIPAHVHVGVLGWNGLLTFAMFYYIIPKMYRTELYSKKLVGVHFWIAILGMLFWVVPMYIAAFTQGLMWKEFAPSGLLKYPNFLETVLQIVPMYRMRALGGTLYLTGVCIMVYNLVKTMQQGKLVPNEPAEAPALTKEFHPTGIDTFWHRAIERKGLTFTVLALVAVAIGTMIELIPIFTVASNVPTIASVKPYTPLELEGRDLYIREGCVSCHSQMIRPFRSEIERYGEYSKVGEFVYDHPFLWGSKRTGPDLHRLGAKYSNSWHYNHMMDPRLMSPGSIMPPYPWLLEQTLDSGDLAKKISAMRTLGVPYAEGYEDGDAQKDLEAQQQAIVDNLAKDNVQTPKDSEIVALIAYLQRLGTDIKAK